MIFRILVINLFFQFSAFCCIYGQQIVATSGTEYKSSVAYISFTIGEPLTLSYLSTGTKVTQGFQQSYISVGSNVKDMTFDFDINCFPIPTSQKLTIESTHQIRGFEVQMINSVGQIIRIEKIESNTTVLDLSMYPKGIYCLMLLDTKSNIKSKRKITIE